MPTTTNEIDKEIKETEKSIKALKEQRDKLVKNKLKRFPDCCEEVCKQINNAIDHILSNITKAKIIKEKPISKELEYTLRKDIFSLESQLKKLNEMRDELYARGTCNCHLK